MEDNSQIIYLEIDTDITEVSRLLSQTKAKQIRLVVPAKSGLLRSSINLKLLKKQIASSKKEVILVCPDQDIQKLILRSGLQVASTVKSKVIEMTSLATSDLDPASGNQVSKEEPVVSDMVTEDLTKESDLKEEDEEPSGQSTLVVKQFDPESSKQTPSSSKADLDASTKTAVATDSEQLKIPDFDHFRRKFLIIGGLGVVAVSLILVGVLTPKAKVTVSLQAEQVPINLSLDQSEFEQAGYGQITDQETLTTTVVASEQKDLGSVAQGNVVIQNCEDSDAHSLKKGTKLISGGLSFELDQAITIPAGIFSAGGTVCSTPLVEAGIKASEKGSDYNLTQASFGFTELSANFKATGTTSGGESKIVKVIAQSDIDQARAALIATNTLEEADLVSQIDQNQSRLVKGSYSEVVDQESLADPVGSQVDQTELKLVIKSSLDYLELKGIGVVLDQYLQENSDGSKQIFDNGAESVEPSYQDGQITITTTGYLGPKFDQERIISELRFVSKKQVREVVKEYIDYQDLQVDGGITLLSRMPIFGSKIGLELEVTNI
ncbi:hypothetical protein H6792_01645 [Candidatus Nomurabacteria bacterium]|nr:hypothetical protein [Candidatus Nomurabacteria bacterium]